MEACDEVEEQGFPDFGMFIDEEIGIDVAAVADGVLGRGRFAGGRERAVGLCVIGARGGGFLGEAGRGVRFSGMVGEPP